MFSPYSVYAIWFITLFKYSIDFLNFFLGILCVIEKKNTVLTTYYPATPESIFKSTCQFLPFD